MAEYRVVAEKRKFGDLGLRLVLWASVVALTAVMLFSLFGSPDQISTLGVPLAWFTAIIVICVGVLGNVFVVRTGLAKIRRSLVFELTEESLICKRPGWPDVQIGFSEIVALLERPGWLIVKAPQRTIMISDQVEGFGSIRAELAKHAVITASPRRSLLAFVPLPLLLVAWGLVLLSNKPGLVVVAAASGVILLTWSNVRLLKSFPKNRSRQLIWLYLGFSWLAVIWVISVRLAHLRWQ